MAEQNVTVTLSEAERLELERILIDRDAGAALEFLARAVHAKLAQAERGQ